MDLEPNPLLGPNPCGGDCGSVGLSQCNPGHPLLLRCSWSRSSSRAYAMYIQSRMAYGPQCLGAWAQNSHPVHSALLGL